MASKCWAGRGSAWWTQFCKVNKFWSLFVWWRECPQHTISTQECLGCSVYFITFWKLILKRTLGNSKAFMLKIQNTKSSGSIKWKENCNYTWRSLDLRHYKHIEDEEDLSMRFGIWASDSWCYTPVSSKCLFFLVVLW